MDHEVRDNSIVKPSLNDRSKHSHVQATIKAIPETTEGLRLQVSFGSETALIYPWQIVLEDR